MYLDFCAPSEFFLLISQSLEDVDNSKGALTEGESSKARKTPDTELNAVLDDEEDEGIEEEEEEHLGMSRITVRNRIKK